VHKFALQGVDESRGISKSKLAVGHGAAAKYFCWGRLRKKPVKYAFCGSRAALQLSRYRGEKIHDQNFK